MARREANWTLQEKNLLVQYVKIYKHEIENKSMNCVSNSKKEEAWQKISECFLAHGFARDKKKLKEQWKRMKIAAKTTIKHKKFESGSDVTIEDIEESIQPLNQLLPNKFHTGEIEQLIQPVNPATLTKSHSMEKKHYKNMAMMYEHKCLKLYKRKILLEIKHEAEMHNMRKRWEEKIYKLKFELLQKKVETGDVDNIDHIDHIDNVDNIDKD